MREPISDNSLDGPDVSLGDSDFFLFLPYLITYGCRLADTPHLHLEKESMLIHENN